MQLLRYAQCLDRDPTLLEFRSENVNPHSIPPYVVLSHRWISESDEVRQEDLANGHAKGKRGYQKVDFCAKQANRDGYVYFWIDTCCIDQKSSADISEAINSMFKLYRNAAKCYVYMLDVSSTEQSRSVHTEGWNDQFRASDWFKRGWTLQELIAPDTVEFFSVEGKLLGDRKSLEQEILQITGIPIDALRGAPLSQFSLEERLTWAKGRVTTKEEDAAYCLLGLFQVHMPLLYGEGKENAMTRLIKATDLSHQLALSVMAEPPWLVPFERNKHFVGRVSELATIEEKLFVPDQTSTLAITGLSGVGKTQCLLEYLYRLREAHKDYMILWINAATSESLSQGFTSIAQRLNIPGWTDQRNDPFQLIRGCLEKISIGRWILVFDKADDIDMWMAPWPIQKKQSTQAVSHRLIDSLPRNELGSIIFTTRNLETAHIFAGSDIIKLSAPNEASAIDILQQRLLSSDLMNNSNAVKTLLAELAYLPLAIVQAAAYINTKSCTLVEYLELLDGHEEEAIDVLSRGLGAEERHYDLKDPIATTWLISFQHIRQHHPLAAEYLSMMACVHYQDIPRLLLPLQQSPLKQRDAIGTLMAYSFVERQNADSVMFSLPRLVHLAARDWLRKENTFSEWVVKTCARLKEMLHNDNDSQNRHNWEMCLPHARYLLNSGQAEKSAKYLLGEGRWIEAEALLTELIDLEKRVSDGGASAFETLLRQANLNRLALKCREQGKLIEAGEPQVLALEESKDNSET